MPEAELYRATYFISTSLYLFCGMNCIALPYSIPTHPHLFCTRQEAVISKLARLCTQKKPRAEPDSTGTPAPCMHACRSPVKRALLAPGNATPVPGVVKTRNWQAHLAAGISVEQLRNVRAHIHSLQGPLESLWVDANGVSRHPCQRPIVLHPLRGTLHPKSCQLRKACWQCLLCVLSIPLMAVSQDWM